MVAPASFSFFADGDPKGQPRPRAFARGGKARVYDPGTAEGFKGSVAVAAKLAGLSGRNIDGPISVRLIAFFRRPKAHYRKTGLRGDAPKFHTSKPDTDNLAKAVLDALTVIGSWGDDAQVANLYVEKRYGERAGVSAEVTVLEDPLP